MTVIGSYQVWPEGLTWCYVGTVQEDGTAGTHIASLTVTPGLGNEMQVLGGSILTGNTATSTDVFVRVFDAAGGRELLRFMSATVTSANSLFNFPTSMTAPTTFINAATNIIVSGLMVLQLNTSTAAISVTQTFAVVARIKGSAPTATLADTVGTPVLTVNTSKVFG